MNASLSTSAAVHAVLLGTAVGDALGLPAEGLSLDKTAPPCRLRSAWRSVTP
jgi:hypothetical protein